MDVDSELDMHRFRERVGDLMRAIEYNSRTLDMVRANEILDAYYKLYEFKGFYIVKGEE